LAVENVEVAIIGAGPAGASAAYEAASEGHETVVFEEHPQVGRPPHCTGIMWAPNYRRAGLQFPNSIVQTNPDYVRVYFGLERSITFHAPGFTIVDRPALDRYLAEKATKAGAEVRVSNYVSKIQRKDSEWVVSVRSLNGAEEIRSKVLICADGHGTLLRHIGIQPPVEIISCMQYEVRTERSEKSIIDAYLSPELAPGGYGWIVPSGDGKAKIGVGVRNSPRPCMYYMQNLLKYGLEDSMEIAERYGGIVQTSGVIKRNLEDGLMVVGGAAGYVNPITGAGIVSGFWSGKIAGQAAATGLKKDDVSKEGLAEFKNHSHASLDEPFDRTLALRIAYDKLGGSEFDGLYQLVDKYAITSGFKRRRMLKAAIRAVIQHPNLAGFFFSFARARDAMTL
jgi:digeranylgeranylglycerophospholipid reductase